MSCPFLACRVARWLSCCIACGSLVLLPALAGAQANTGPARVVVATAAEGTITPTATFKGSVKFKNVAEVATEVSGKVLSIEFETGQHLSEGAVLVTLDAELLKADRTAAAARAGQAEAELQLERVRMKRAEELLAEEVTTPQEFDDIRFTVRALEQRLEAARADIARLDRELEKKVIRTPFPGVIIQRSAELGEWLSAGATVAVYARDAVYDVMVNLPEENLAWSKVGDKVPLHVAGRNLEGEVHGELPARATPSPGPSRCASASWGRIG
jgi:RND family efflux transporter MFP subunit